MDRDVIKLKARRREREKEMGERLVRSGVPNPELGFMEKPREECTPLAVSRRVLVR